MKLAEEIYAERKGRMNVGIRHDSITAKELVRLYQAERQKQITSIPHQGITQSSFNTLCNHIKYWEQYLSLIHI